MLWGWVRDCRKAAKQQSSKGGDGCVCGRWSVEETILVNRRGAERQRTQRIGGSVWWEVLSAVGWGVSLQRRQRARMSGSRVSTDLQRNSTTCASLPPPVRNAPRPSACFSPILRVLCLSAVKRKNFCNAPPPSTHPSSSLLLCCFAFKTNARCSTSPSPPTRAVDHVLIDAAALIHAEALVADANHLAIDFLALLHAQA
jgi:hypothetical protein